jgi:hypothetical protein
MKKLAAILLFFGLALFISNCSAPRNAEVSPDASSLTETPQTHAEKKDAARQQPATSGKLLRGASPAAKKTAKAVEFEKKAIDQ